MRTNITRCALAVFTVVVLSGCRSGGQWSMPNLAFWKSSPFQSAPDMTPGTVGSPVKPSGIATNSRSAPPSAYASGTTAPAWVPPSTPTAPKVTYPSTATTNANPAATVPAAYTASTAGVPGAGAYGTPRPSYPNTAGPCGTGTVAPAAPYGATNPYTNTATPSSYNAAATATPYGAPGSRYTPTGAAANPVRSTPSYPNTAPSRYGNSADGASRYNAGANSDDRDTTPTSGANPGNYDRTAVRPSYNNVEPRYGATTSATPGSLETNATTLTDNRYPSLDNRSPSPNDGSAPLVGSRYASPSAAPPTTGSGRYTPPTGYGSPVDSDATTPTPTDSQETPAYRPGSTTNYVPHRASTTSPAAPNAGGVTPASYTLPASGATR